MFPPCSRSLPGTCRLPAVHPRPCQLLCLPSRPPSPELQAERWQPSQTASSTGQRALKLPCLHGLVTHSLLPSGILSILDLACHLSPAQGTLTITAAAAGDPAGDPPGVHSWTPRGRAGV